MSNPEDELANEWASRNFRGLMNTLENQQAEIQELKQTMITLQNHVTMQYDEIKTFETRLNTLQYGQVLGAMSPQGN